MTVLNAYPNLAGFIGVGVEATKGTGVAATEYLPLLDESLAVDPGILLVETFGGARDPIHTSVVGEQKVTGKVDVPLYVDQGMALLGAAIGDDVYQFSSAAGTGQVIGGTGVAAGATVVVIATQTSPVIAANDFIELHQLGVGVAVGVTNLSEVHKVQSVSGAGPYTVTLVSGETVANAYASTGSAYRIPSTTTAFSHVLQPDQPTAATYRTLTIEKNRGGLDSRQYAGVTVKKASLKMATKDFAKMSYDLTALTDINLAPTTPTFGTSAPLALANFAISLFGTSDTSVVSFDFDVDNGVKEYHTFASQNLPSLAVPLKRLLKGKWVNIAQSATYYANALAGTTGAVTLTLTQGANSITIALPKFVITKVGQPLKIGELFMFDADFAAYQDDSSGYDVRVTVVNSKWLPFV